MSAVKVVVSAQKLSSHPFDFIFNEKISVEWDANIFSSHKKTQITGIIYASRFLWLWRYEIFMRLANLNFLNKYGGFIPLLKFHLHIIVSSFLFETSKIINSTKTILKL